MSYRPEVRARHLQTVLASIEQLPEPGRSKVVSTLDPAVLPSVEGATGLEWLPMELDVAVTHAVHRALGPPEFQRFYRTLFADVFRGPVFRSFAKAAHAVFGDDPAGWMRWLPEMWNISFRNCGRWSIAPGGAGRAGLILSELPPGPVADRVWPTAVAAALSASLDIAGTE